MFYCHQKHHDHDHDHHNHNQNENHQHEHEHHKHRHLPTRESDSHKFHALNRDRLHLNERTCGAHTKSKELMDIDENYKNSYKKQQRISDQYVNKMKQRKYNRINNINNNNNDERRMFSEYDDQIDNEPVILIPIVYHVLYRYVIVGICIYSFLFFYFFDNF